MDGHGSQTTFRDDAETMSVPPRPATEMLPVGARSVTVVSGGRTATFRAAATVAELVSLVNGLPRVPAAITSCPADLSGAGPSWQLALRFGYAGGRSYRVREMPGCGAPVVRFGPAGGQPGLADPQERLLTTARALLGLPPRV